MKPFFASARTATAVLALGLPAASIAAQQPDYRVVLRGQIVDAVTEAPLHGAFIAQRGVDTGYLTGEDGAFALPVPQSRHYPLTIEHLGYETLEIDYEGGTDPAPFRIRLTPNPIVLEGLRVMSDRFENRRRRVAISTRAFDREALVRAPPIDVVDFLSSRAGVYMTYCPNGGSLAPASLGGGFGAPFSATRCALVRGRRTTVTVAIDEAPAFGGLDELATYRPQDLYLLEVYGRGQHVRAYTVAFMEKMARSGRRLMPVPLFY